jgi:hypothetical protein
MTGFTVSTFGAKVRQGFRVGVAAAVGVRADKVVIRSVSDKASLAPARRTLSTIQSGGLNLKHGGRVLSIDSSSSGVVVDFSVVIPKDSSSSRGGADAGAGTGAGAAQHISTQLQTLIDADPTDSASPIALLVQIVRVEIEKEGGVVPAGFGMALAAPVTTLTVTATPTRAPTEPPTKSTDTPLPTNLPSSQPSFVKPIIVVGAVMAVAAVGVLTWRSFTTSSRSKVKPQAPPKSGVAPAQNQQHGRAKVVYLATANTNL